MEEVADQHVEPLHSHDRIKLSKGEKVVQGAAAAACLEVPLTYLVVLQEDA